MSPDRVSGGYEPFPGFASFAFHAPDLSVVDEYAALLDQTKATTGEAALGRAVRTATRYAAVDTGAIEGLYTTNRGFTRTIAEQTATWEVALAQHGEHVRRSIEDALAGYDVVLDLVTGRRPMTEAWIRELYAVLCASQDTYQVITGVGPQKQSLPKGCYKTLPNNPTSTDTGHVHHYASVDDTAPEMARLIREISSDAFVQSHPVVQAAYVHYAFACVHPFADGNGRVARALASVYLYRSPGVPLVVFADQKDRYIDALEAADRGQPESFISFIAERAVDTIGLVRLRMAGAPGAAASLQRLQADLASTGVLWTQEQRTLVGRLIAVVAEEISEMLSTEDLPEQVMTSVVAGGAVDPPPGYVDTQAGQLGYEMHAKPVPVGQLRRLGVFAAKPGHQGADFVATSPGSPLSLEVSLRDISPEVTQVLRLKLRAWLEALFGQDVAQFGEAVHAALERSGLQAGDIPPTDPLA